MCLLLFRPRCWIHSPACRLTNRLLSGPGGANTLSASKVLERKKPNIFTSALLLFAFISCCCHRYRITHRQRFFGKPFLPGPKHTSYDAVDTLEQHLRGIRYKFALDFIQGFFYLFKSGITYSTHARLVCMCTLGRRCEGAGGHVDEM